MKKRKLVLTLLSLSIISLCAYVGIVAYNWGYMQSAIDNRVAAFSAPAYVSIITGVPFIVISAVLAIIIFIINKRN